VTKWENIHCDEAATKDGNEKKMRTRTVQWVVRFQVIAAVTLNWLHSGTRYDVILDIVSCFMLTDAVASSETSVHKSWNTRCRISERRSDCDVTLRSSVRVFRRFQ
jgi:hypothetical protein